MAEYIEREAKCGNCVHFEVCEPHTEPNESFPEVGGCPLFLNKADVAEVRHGEWVHTEEPLGWRDVDCIECSSCHESWIMDDDLCLDDYKDGWKYCPNCGAKMDGKVIDNA